MTDTVHLSHIIILMNNHTFVLSYNIERFASIEIRGVMLESVVRNVSPDGMCRRTECVAGRNVSPDGMCRRTECVAGRNVSPDGMCRRTECVAGRNVSPDGMCRRTECVAGRNVSPDGMCRRTECVAARNVSPDGMCRRTECVAGRNVSPDGNCFLTFRLIHFDYPILVNPELDVILQFGVLNVEVWGRDYLLVLFFIFLSLWGYLNHNLFCECKFDHIPYCPPTSNFTLHN